MLILKGLLSLHTIDILGQLVLGCGGCPVLLCVMCSSIPGLYPPDVLLNTPPPHVMAVKTGTASGGQSHLHLRTLPNSAPPLPANIEVLQITELPHAIPKLSEPEPELQGSCHQTVPPFYCVCG